MLTHALVAHVVDDIDDVGFWSNTFRQDQLRKWIMRQLDESQLSTRSARVCVYVCVCVSVCVCVCVSLASSLI